MLVYHNSNPKVKHLNRKDLLRYDVIMISCELLTRRVIAFSLMAVLDSGLESMYRKEMKGWNREDGIVKEDSTYLSIIHLTISIIDHLRRRDTFDRFPPADSRRSTQHQG